MIHSNNAIITMDEYNLMHEEHTKILQDEINRAKDDNKKLVIFTHHKPTLKRYLLILFRILLIFFFNLITHKGQTTNWCNNNVSK